MTSSDLFATTHHRSGLHCLDAGQFSFPGAVQAQQKDGQARLARLEAHLAGLHHEQQAMEEALLHAPTWAAQLKGQRLVYVGGRPRSNAALRNLVQQAGGEFVLHTGLIDDDGHAGGFAALLPGTNRVFCPLDLIDHESLAALRRLCARHGVPGRALRSASVSSFVAGLLKLPQTSAIAQPGSRFCIRHG